MDCNIIVVAQFWRLFDVGGGLLRRIWYKSMSSSCLFFMLCHCRNLAIEFGTERARCNNFPFSLVSTCILLEFSDFRPVGCLSSY